MVNIIDLIFIALAVVVVVASSRKGFVKSCLDTFAVVVAGFASFKLYLPASEWAYDLIVKNLVKNAFSKTLNDLNSSLPFSEKVAAMIDELPQGAIKLASGIGIDIDNIVKGLNQSIASEKEVFVDVMAEKIGQPIMFFVTEIVMFMVLLVVGTLLIRFFATFFSATLKKIPVMGKLDSLLGGVLGVVKAAIILVAVTTLFYIFLQTADAGSPLETISSSKIYIYLAELNPVISAIR